MKKLVFFLSALVVLALIGAAFFYSKSSVETRIGYFHGGRTAMFYRTSVNGWFEKLGVPVSLLTKSLHGTGIYEMPNFIREKTAAKESNMGKATGTELVSLILSGEVHGATIGETAFVMMLENGAPIVAVAELGHDVKERAGHALVLRSTIKITGPQSFRGLRLGARRSAGGDEVVLKEFISQQGLDPGRDVEIVSNVPDDKMGKLIDRGHLDGAYAHLRALRNWITRKDHRIYVYRPLDWINPEMSQSLLVFDKAFLEKHRDRVQKIVFAYMSQIKAEQGLGEAEKMQRNKKGLEISTDFGGLDFPQTKDVPFIRADLLNDWQKLLLKHGAIQKAVDIEGAIDNSFVAAAEKEIYGSK